MVIINIDTSKDSNDEIKKTIKYLQHLVGEEATTEHVSPSNDTMPVMDMFGANSSTEPVMPAMNIFSDETTKELSEDEKDAETLLKTVSDTPDVEMDDDDDPVIEIVEYED